MIVLGIDPGLANTGYGVIARRGSRFEALAEGVVQTPPHVPAERRLATIREQLADTLRRHGCEAMALEELYFGQNARSAFAVGHARGVAMLSAGERGIPCFSYTPQQVKAAVCGHGRAGKEQVARMVAALLGMEHPPRADHASDALAVALCHLNTVPFRMAASDATRAAAELVAR